MTSYLRFLKILQIEGRIDLNKILVRSYKRQAYSWIELSKVGIRSTPASAQILIRVHRQEQFRLTIAHLQSDIESLNRNIRMHSAPSNSRYNDVNSRRCFATLQIASIHTI